MSTLQNFLMEQIAELYYNRDMAQQEIAKYLNISKMNVSRILQKAKNTHVVETTVHPPFLVYQTLAQQLEKTFALEKAIVVGEKQKSSDCRSFLGAVAAYYLITEIPQKITIGMGVGNTIGKLVEHLPSLTTTEVKVVQLMGGLTAVSSGNPLSILQETCRSLSAEGAYVSSSAIQDSAEMKKMVFENEIRQNGVYRLWETCNEAYFGIGSIESGTFFAEHLRNEKDMQEMCNASGIGDILGHCFNQDGVFIESSIEDKLISIPVALLRNVPKRVAIAGGSSKRTAIEGALKTGLITHLFIDKTTAEAILEKK